VLYRGGGKVDVEGGGSTLAVAFDWRLTLGDGHIFAEHDGGRVGVGSWNFRDDRCVDDPQSLDADESAAVVHDLTQSAGADGMGHLDAVVEKPVVNGVVVDRLRQPGRAWVSGVRTPPCRTVEVSGPDVVGRYTGLAVADAATRLPSLSNMEQ
jgi:hypothetical protein